MTITRAIRHMIPSLPEIPQHAWASVWQEACTDSRARMVMSMGKTYLCLWPALRGLVWIYAILKLKQPLSRRVAEGHLVAIDRMVHIPGIKPITNQGSILDTHFLECRSGRFGSDLSSLWASPPCRSRQNQRGVLPMTRGCGRHYTREFQSQGGGI